ncbi:MAG: hypothetical protein NWE94_01835 [Candidatus Bathyarchaeota archaeon]|nr:hypothetical protein [Candidatus Bathyarchaeota archaeon]
MTRYRSSFECTVCHEHMVWDSDTKTLSCACGRFHCEFVNLREYHPIPCDTLQRTLPSRG